MYASECKRTHSTCKHTDTHTHTHRDTRIFILVSQFLYSSLIYWYYAMSIIFRDCIYRCLLSPSPSPASASDDLAALATTFWVGDWNCRYGQRKVERVGGAGDKHWDKSNYNDDVKQATTLWTPSIPRQLLQVGHIGCKCAHSGLHRISTSPSALLSVAASLLKSNVVAGDKKLPWNAMSHGNANAEATTVFVLPASHKWVWQGRAQVPVCVHVCVRPSQGKFWSLMKLHNCRDWRSISASSASSRVELSYEIASTYYTIFINIFLPRLLLLP